MWVWQCGEFAFKIVKLLLFFFSNNSGTAYFHWVGFMAKDRAEVCFGTVWACAVWQLACVGPFSAVSGLLLRPSPQTAAVLLPCLLCSGRCGQRSRPTATEGQYGGLPLESNGPLAWIRVFSLINPLCFLQLCHPSIKRGKHLRPAQLKGCKNN